VNSCAASLQLDGGDFLGRLAGFLIGVGEGHGYGADPDESNTSYHTHLLGSQTSPVHIQRPHAKVPLAFDSVFSPSGFCSTSALCTILRYAINMCL
jgi:hypothetical protein